MAVPVSDSARDNGALRRHTVLRPTPAAYRCQGAAGQRRRTSTSLLRQRLRTARDEPGRDRWLGYTANDREYALMLRHRRPRPWLVCVHGTEMGRAALDLTVFRVRHLHRDLGLNVVLPVLPMHGPRCRRLPKGAVFPGEDVLDNVHATAQAVWDIRRLVSWIRRQQPESPIGLNAISLGGYVASLVASLEDDLARDRGRTGGRPRGSPRPPRGPQQR